ncbi:hypothetical protein [Spiroplasma citri]|uniref:Uncharacterized protein n=1 Tax=Spiroplasma citri TaxID=2133 RepID=Q14NY0_SPICI|nr:hypothetical protein [Spiroplasma citri]APE75225.1 hypothetical protein SCITRI_001350 [Spiroplasma citri]QED25133.1 hypothetical protein FRX96_07090 [Spiroplasma citri]QIA67469.1 hypothetical protein GMI18_07430 [Spiroplasma citri]QIA69325.1 hypothetical protein GL298_07395 [Spiroplasma citri]QIA71192.1 hypothetical protein GL981_07450 [Spiroplasma citri]
MYLLKHVRDVNNNVLNIVITGDKITAILSKNELSNFLRNNNTCKIINFEPDTYVSYGWIDCS